MVDDRGQGGSTRGEPAIRSPDSYRVVWPAVCLRCSRCRSSSSLRRAYCRGTLRTRSWGVTRRRRRCDSGARAAYRPWVLLELLELAALAVLGHFGHSLVNGQAVAAFVGQRIVNSAALLVVAGVVSTFAAVVSRSRSGSEARRNLRSRELGSRAGGHGAARVRGGGAVDLSVRRQTSFICCLACRTSRLARTRGTSLSRSCFRR